MLESLRGLTQENVIKMEIMHAISQITYRLYFCLYVNQYSMITQLQ